ncbi:Sensor histidine kinase DcuS [Glutamicibacter creatinolyticus]|uniref:Sensor-like histidine kinase SenX3 n=1 Tax=Glutamicibacter creatinolyticus TaxID=162496 RepID=A0A5B7WQ88_9MICC|nr:sensor histidine kinase [Glutamicibacter creatinolyticus]QCY46047.1 Sensor histidine kinase DcuS [Glutamicibacter creatinolyticus]
MRSTTATSRRLSGKHFASRIMRLQFAVLGLLILVVTAATIAVRYDQVFERAEATALGIARTVAADPQVRQVAAEQAERERLDAGSLRRGPLQAQAEAVRRDTGAAFVVITEDRGLRLTHPNPRQIGQRVSTDPVALSGVEDVSREHGTLGDSVRAKVPVRAPGTDAVVGEVSVGLATESLTRTLLVSISWIILFALLAAVLATLVGRATVRRLKRETLGLEPAEIAQLVRDQQAVLYGVTDGVMGLGSDGVITVRNKAARQMLGLPHRTELADVVGRHYAAAGLNERLVTAIRQRERTPVRLEVGQTSLIARINDVVRDGVDLGQVILLRDVTVVEALGTKLDAVQDMADALRAQRHEFANRMHAVLGLLHQGRIDQARDYLREVTDSGPAIVPVQGLETVSDPYLAAFIAAKGISAHEMGIELRISPDSMLYAPVASAHDAQDVTAVLGNMLDNAFTASLGAEAPRWVEVDLLSEGSTLHLAVADSGAGITTAQDIFNPAVTTGSQLGAGHGHGVGLPLIRRLARARGGDVWVADRGGEHGGAVIAARLPSVLSEERKG